MKKLMSGKKISVNKPSLSVFTSVGQLLEANTFRLHWASGRGQCHEIGPLLCLPTGDRCQGQPEGRAEQSQAGERDTSLTSVRGILKGSTPSDILFGSVMQLV